MATSSRNGLQRSHFNRRLRSTVTGSSKNRVRISGVQMPTMVSPWLISSTVYRHCVYYNLHAVLVYFLINCNESLQGSPCAIILRMANHLMRNLKRRKRRRATDMPILNLSISDCSIPVKYNSLSALDIGVFVVSLYEYLLSNHSVVKQQKNNL